MKPFSLGIAAAVAMLCLSSTGWCAPQTGATPTEDSTLYTIAIPLDQLAPRKDALLVELSGTVGPGELGHVLSLRRDGDLHFVLRVPDITTAFVCEMMNARSIPPAAAQNSTYWEDRFARLFVNGRQKVTATGVFRVWPDHIHRPEAEAAEEESWGTSNPSHLIELHPLTAIGDGRTQYDVRASVAPITLQGRPYAYKRPGRWISMMSQTVDARVIQRDQRDFLEIRTPQISVNYWALDLQVQSAPTVVPNGHRFTVRVVTPTRTYPESIRAFTVTGSPADAGVAKLQPGQMLTAFAIGRFDLAKLLRPGGYHGPPPVELCLFGLQRQPPRPTIGRGEAKP